MNIKFKGLFVGEEQLVPKEVENAHIFQEASSIDEQIKKGLLLSLPLILSALLIAIEVFYYGISLHLMETKKVMLSLLISIIVIFVFQFIHEIIHSIFYPSTGLKEIYYTKHFASLFVYCTSLV